MAPIASDFVQHDPDEGAAPTQRTEVRFLYDDEALFIGARMSDAAGAAGITSRLARRDDDPNSDTFQVVLDTYHDHLGRTVFKVSPAGAKYDAQGVGTDDPDPSWDAVWEVATRVDAGGWTAEFRIPLSQLRLPDMVDQVWGLQMWRAIRRRNELDQWAYWTKIQPGGPAFFGHLTGLTGLRARHRAELAPYTTFHYRGAPTSASRSNDLTARLGADARLTIGPAALTATVNPDFGQVEVDPAVLNLTSFETVLPEKRPFFVDGSALLSFGGIGCLLCSDLPQLSLVYSRRVGRPPSLAVAGPVLDAPEATRILGAVKLVSQSTAGTTLAALDAVAMREHAVVADVGGTADVRTEPWTNYAVLRARHSARSGAVVLGGIVTSTDRAWDSPALAALLPRSARALGLDGDVWSATRDYHLSFAMAASSLRGDSLAIGRVASSNAHYLQRPDRGGGPLDRSATGLQGYSATVRLAKESGAWQGETAAGAISPGFDVNSMGFMHATGVLWLVGNAQRTFTRPTHLYHALTLLAGLERERNYDGDLVGAREHARITLVTRSFWTVETTAIVEPQHPDDRLLRGGPVAITAGVRTAKLTMASDARRAAVLNAGLTEAFGGDGGRATSLTFGVTARPSSGVRVSLAPAYTTSTSASHFVAAVTDPTASAFFGHRYVVAALRQRAISLEARASIALTPRLSLDLYVQPFLASGWFHDFGEFVTPRTLARGVYGRDGGTIAPQDGGSAPSRTYMVDPDGTGPAPAFVLRNPTFTDRSLRGNAILRWEWSPGSTLFVAWTQMRALSDDTGDLNLGRDTRALFSAPATNVVVVKAVYWLAR